jgi:hypothetical protein
MPFKFGRPRCWLARPIASVRTMKRFSLASFIAHLRAGPDWPRRRAGGRPLGPARIHPARSVANDLPTSVERPASQHCDRRGVTRVAIHLVLTWVVRSSLRTFSRIRPSVAICQPKTVTVRRKSRNCRLAIRRPSFKNSARVIWVGYAYTLNRIRGGRAGTPVLLASAGASDAGRCD